MMTDAWAAAEALSKKTIEGGGIFLRLVNDGDGAMVVFRGGPYPRQCTGPGRVTPTAPVRVYATKDGSMKMADSSLKCNAQ